MQPYWFAAVVGLTLIGCGADRSAEVVCDHLCGCQEPLPSDRQACVEACVADLDDRELPSSCVACVLGTQCDGDLARCEPQCPTPNTDSARLPPSSDPLVSEMP